METVKKLIQKLKELPEDSIIFNNKCIESFLELKTVTTKDKKVVGIILETKVITEVERILND
jgi:hypothetical protein